MDQLTNEEECPRCGGLLRQFPEDLGALSRADDETTVCGPCGQEEAVIYGRAGIAAGALQASPDQIARQRLRRIAQAAVHPVTGERPWSRYL
jgi:hypothetical protein